MLWESIRRFMIRHWIALTVGFTLTAICIWKVYPIRGRGAIGSEWFITPFLVFISMKVNEEKMRRKAAQRRYRELRQQKAKEEKLRRFKRCVVNVDGQ